MSDDILSSDMGVLWLQPNGPNTALQLLGCHDVGDVAQPQGTVTTRYKPSLSGPGKWGVASRRQGPPGDVTTSITTYVKTVADYLQGYKGCGALYIHQSTCGKVDIFDNYDNGNLLYEALITNKGKSNLASREGADNTEQSFDISAASPLEEYWKLAVTKQVTDVVMSVMDIAICGEDRCWGACGPASDKCDTLCFVSKGAVAAKAEVQCTLDGGNIWTQTAVLNWAVAINAVSLVCFPVGRGIMRRVIAQGTAAAGLLVSYSDDEGATWADVLVNAVAADFAVGPGALWAVDMYHVWLVDDDGGVYFSSDGAVTWAEQVTANAASLTYVHFCDDHHGLFAGATNILYATSDGGVHWRLIVTPAAKAAVTISTIRCLDRYRWWIGYADGDLYYTFDGGDTWAERVLPPPDGMTAQGGVADMDFYNHYHGCLAVQWTGAAAAARSSVYRTVNGGISWERYDIAETFDVDGTPGLNSIIMCNPNLIYTVGDPIGALGSVYVLAPAP